MANYDNIVNKALDVYEGGKYTNHPNDSGGPTKWGITQQVLKEWRGTSVSEDDVKALTRDEAKQIYIARYWTPLKLSQVNHQLLAETMFDHGLNAGIGRSAKMVQEILNTQFGKNLAVDGAIGNQSIQAINSVNGDKLYNAFNYMRGKYYTYIANRYDYNQSDSTYYANFFSTHLRVSPQEKNASFIKGWLNRLSSFPYLKVGAGIGIFLFLATAFFL